AVFHVGEDPARRWSGGGVASCDEAGAIGSASVQVQSCSCPAWAGISPSLHSIGWRPGRVNRRGNRHAAMIVAWIVLACAAGCLLAWLLLFPGPGQAFADACRRFGRALRAAAGGAARHAAGRVHGVSRGIHAGGANAVDGVVRHRWVLLVAIVVLCVPAMLILWTRQRVVFEGFEGRDMARSRTAIARLLRGERLVPPPPPPPALFRTEEITRLKPE